MKTEEYILVTAEAGEGGGNVSGRRSPGREMFIMQWEGEGNETGQGGKAQTSRGLIIQIGGQNLS